MTSRRIRLIHWDVAEAQARGAMLRAAGYDVAPEPLTPAVMRQMRHDPPAAVVIDLTRLPSQGRDAALQLRQSKATRHVPLVFVDGDPAKVARIRELLPVAVYATWDHIRDALEQALAHPPSNLAPQSVFAGYTGVPLVKKLGIKANAVVALIDAPSGFETTLGELPNGVTLRQQVGGRCDLIVWFVKSCEELERNIERMRQAVGEEGLWIAWPKKVSGVASDLSQTIVRQVGLAAGLVDYKTSAIDTTWAGLRFTHRKSK